MILCKNCGAYISDKAQKCPKCGASTTDLVKTQPVEKAGEAIRVTYSTTQQEYGTRQVSDTKFQDDRANKNRKWIMIACAIILIVGGAIGFWIFQSDHFMEDTSAMEAYEIDDDKPKHINQFSPSVLVNADLLINDSRALRSLNTNWESELLELGFQKGTKLLEREDLSDYDDELYDIYAIPFTLSTNGKTITVKAFYQWMKRDQAGEWILEEDRKLEFVNDGYLGSSFIISFSDTSDKESFIQSLIDIGYNRYIDDSDGKSSYRSTYNGETLGDDMIFHLNGDNISAKREMIQ